MPVPHSARHERANFPASEWTRRASSAPCSATTSFSSRRRSSTSRLRIKAGAARSAMRRCWRCGVRLNTVQSKARLNHQCTRRRCTLIPTPCSPPPCQLCRKISERRSWFETQRSPRLPFGTAPSRPNWHHTEGPGRTFSPGSAAQERGCRAARLGAPLRPGFLDLN